MSEIRGVPPKKNFTPCEVYDKKIQKGYILCLQSLYNQLHFSTENWSFKKQENPTGMFLSFFGGDLRLYI